MRQLNETPINCEFKDANLLKNLSLNALNKHPSYKIKQSIEQKNLSQITDKHLYEVIDKCKDIQEI